MKPFWDLLDETLGENFAEDHELQDTIRQLSAAFTEDRAALPRDYLEDPELQAAYLAYFVPLNFEKVYLLLSSMAGVWPKELDLTRPQLWLDFGSGPGTATLAALAAFKNRYKKLEKLPQIHVLLVDTQTGALNLADNLVRGFAAKLGLEVETELLTELPMADTGRVATYDLSLAANVLNELPAEASAEARELLMQVWDATSGACLVLEPSHRVASSRLVRFRERLLKDSRDVVTVLGPCKHAEKCPVHRTKDWCHFSEPTREGRLIDLNLRVFKNPRNWLKFSYLLVRRGEAMPAWDGKTFRAVGDLHEAGTKQLAIDLCKPGEKFELRVPKNLPPELRGDLVRGATVTIGENRNITARPITKREAAKTIETRKAERETQKKKPRKIIRR